MEKQRERGEENRLQVIVAESGLEATKAKVMLAKFEDYFRIAAEWEVRAKQIVVTSAEQVDEIALARKGRLFLRTKRLAVENTRKELKEQALREGKAIDGISNVLKSLIIPVEEYLDRQERFVELKAQREAELEREMRREAEEAERAAMEKAEAAERERVLRENETLKREAAKREAEELARRKADEDARRKVLEAARAQRAEAEKIVREVEEKAETLRRESELQLRQEQEKAARERREMEERVSAERRNAAREAAARAEEKRRHEAEVAAMVQCPECGARFSPKDVHVES